MNSVQKKVKDEKTMVEINELELMEIEGGSTGKSNQLTLFWADIYDSILSFFGK